MTDTIPLKFANWQKMFFSNFHSAHIIPRDGYQLKMETIYSLPNEKYCDTLLCFWMEHFLIFPPIRMRYSLRVMYSGFTVSSIGMNNVFSLGTWKSKLWYSFQTKKKLIAKTVFTWQLYFFFKNNYANVCSLWGFLFVVNKSIPVHYYLNKKRIRQTHCSGF